MKALFNWTLLLLAALVVIAPAARLDPVVLVLRVLCFAAWGVFCYDLWRAGALRMSIGQFYRAHRAGAEATRPTESMASIFSVLQMAALLVGTFAIKI